MHARRITPEILDQLPADHPDAVHSRRDIQKFNCLQRNFRWFRQSLAPWIPRDGPLQVLEIGAGCGALGKYLARHFGEERLCITGLDLAPRPPDWPARWPWHQGNVFEREPGGEFTVILANLTLHHFTDAALNQLQPLITPPTRLFLANETHRAHTPQALLPLARLLGINHVTRHDARVSIEGGFAGEELAAALSLTPPDWRAHVDTSFLGTYRLTALRTQAADCAP